MLYNYESSICSSRITNMTGVTITTAIVGTIKMWVSSSLLIQQFFSALSAPQAAAEQERERLAASGLLLEAH